MKIKRLIYTLAAAMILFTLVTMPDACISGAKSGLILWFDTVLPTLFPFFVITRLILELNLCPKILQPFYPVFTGLLSGYPTGAITCSSMLQKGLLNKMQAQKLLIICNNASPAFLISYAAHTCLHSKNSYIIWFCTIAASFFSYFLLTLLSRLTNRNTSKKCTQTSHSSTLSNSLNIPETSDSSNVSFLVVLEETILKSFEILVLVGGYIIIASLIINVVLAFFSYSTITLLVAGILEITAGTQLITSDICSNTIFASEQIKSAAVAALCGFGGLSALMQTHSAIRSSGLSTLKYMLHKLLCGLFSGIICIIITMLI